MKSITYLLITQVVLLISSASVCRAYSVDLTKAKSLPAGWSASNSNTGKGSSVSFSDDGMTLQTYSGGWSRQFISAASSSYSLAEVGSSLTFSADFTGQTSGNLYSFQLGLTTRSNLDTTDNPAAAAGAGGANVWINYNIASGELSLLGTAGTAAATTYANKLQIGEGGTIPTGTYGFTLTHQASGWISATIFYTPTAGATVTATNTLYQATNAVFTGYEGISNLYLSATSDGAGGTNAAVTLSSLSAPGSLVPEPSAVAAAAGACALLLAFGCRRKAVRS